MIVIVNEDANITISKSTGEESIDIEIGEHRGTIEHIFVHVDKEIRISLAPDGFRINI